MIIWRILGLIIFTGVFGLILWRWQINGWGSIIWLASVILMILIRGPHAARNKANRITEQFAVSTERILLALVSLGGTLLPVIYLMTGIPDFADYAAPDWLPLIGLALLLPGFWLFWRSHVDLGRNWSVTTQLREDHALITNGVYAHIRHPMYSAIWLIFAAYPFLIHNWIIGPAGIVTFGVMYIVRVPVEEAMMRQAFGDEYDAYVARTGRLWPRIQR